MGKREPITRPFLVIRHLRQGRPSDTLLETADIIPMWGSLWDLCMELGISGGKGELEDGEALDSLKEIISSVRAGASPMGYDLDTKYYLLGLAPNAARLSVRFYYVQSFGFLLRNCEQYLNDVSMDGVSSLPLKRMFAQTAALGKKENVPSTLVASTFRSLRWMSAIRASSCPQSSRIISS